MSNSMATWFAQLLFIGPMLIVYLGGMILAGMWWRRMPRAAMLAMAGLGVMMVTSIAGPLTTTLLIRNRASSAGSIGQSVMMLNGVFSLVRTIGLALLVAAVFVGRKRDDAAFPIEPNTGPLPPLADLAPSQSTRP